MLVGFFGPAADVEAAKTAGADFLVVESIASTPDAKALRTSAGDLALGVATKVETSDAAQALQEGGVDAALVWDETPAAALQADDLGYVLVLAASADEAYLRALDGLNLEAVLLEKLPSPLTVGAQMGVARISALGRKPLLCLVPGGMAEDELLSLRSAGAVGLMTGAANIAALKEAVAALPAKKQRRDDRPVVALPRAGQAADHGHDDDDDD
jgi:hypothetical protein